MPVIKVNLKERSYPIILGTDKTDRLLSVLKKKVGGNRLFVFYDARFYALYGKSITNKLKKTFKLTEFVLPISEKSKSIKTLNRIYTYLLDEKISRSDFILACGGGVTSDLIGYTAATTLRGINWGVVSTTLLGMVDASIGGKTGINHQMGKNLIGAFWQPSFVVSDIRFLMTLPEREMITGLGEIVKYGGLLGKPMLNLLCDFLNKNNLYDEKILLKLVSLSAEYKAKIVASDERESDKRMLLNFGHTFGHAIEKSLGYGKLFHGEAVLLGLYAACDLSRQVYSQKDSVLSAYLEIIEKIFPLIPFRKINIKSILRAITMDKKRIGHNLKFILLDKPGKPIIVSNVSQRQIEKSIAVMLANYKAYRGKR